MNLRKIGLGLVMISWGTACCAPTSWSQLQTLDVRQGLVLYWNFEEGSGTLIHNLITGGAAQFKGNARWTEGRFSGGLQLNGVDDMIEAPLSDSLKLQGALTIALWIKIIQKGQQINSLIHTDRYRLISGWGLDTRLEILLDGQWRTSGHVNLPLDSWAHVIATYSAAERTLRLYVNGELKRSQVLTDLADYHLSLATVPLRFTQTLKSIPDNRVIIVDEVRIYNRALSGTEAQALYQYVPPPSFAALEVVVNEIAWSGTPASPAHEWIELYNNTERAIDLSGWRVVAKRSGFEIPLRGTITARGYFLLEAQSDNAIKDVKADLVYWGSLKNSGDVLALMDPAGTVIDTANTDGGSWPAGTDFQEPQKASMERVDPGAPDADSNWKTNDGRTRNGRDTQWNALNGTPKAPNSARR